MTSLREENITISPSRAHPHSYRRDGHVVMLALTLPLYRQDGNRYRARRFSLIRLIDAEWLVGSMITHDVVAKPPKSSSCLKTFYRWRMTRSACEE